MDSKAELVASAGSEGDTASLHPQRNPKPPIMPTQGPKSRPETAQRLPSDQYLRGALNEERKLGV